jgi:toxin ParE1/3/4
VIRPRFLPSAEAELLAEVAFYSDARQGLGVRFQAAVEVTLARALEHPTSGVAGRRSTRRLAIKGFPFFLIYRPAADELLVVAVAHQSRRPDYWLARVR